MKALSPRVVWSGTRGGDEVLKGIKSVHIYVTVYLC